MLSPSNSNYQLSTKNSTMTKANGTFKTPPKKAMRNTKQASSVISRENTTNSKSSGKVLAN
jgi:hypothetical protein